MDQIKRAVVCIASCALLIAVGSACSGGGTATITVVKKNETDPSKLELKVEFKAKSWEVEGIVGPGGKVTFTIEGQTFTIEGLCEGTPFKAKYSDPLLVQVPSHWVFVSGTWSNDAGEAGSIIAEPVSAFSPSQQGPFIAEPGHQLLALHSLTLADVDTTGSADLTFDVGPGFAPTLVKAMDVALVTTTDDDCVSPYRSLEPLDSALGVDFGNLPSSHSTVIALSAPIKVPTLDSLPVAGLVLLLVAVGLYLMSRRRDSRNA